MVAQMVKNLRAMWDSWVRSLGQKYTLEKEMVTHSSNLVRSILWAEEPGGATFTRIAKSRTQLSDEHSLSRKPRVGFIALQPW